MKLIKRGFLLVMILLTGAFVFLSFRDRRQEISVYENRYLAAHPGFTLKGVWDGSYFRGWDDYFSDHIYHRDDRMREYEWLQLYLKRVVISNNVVITRDCLLPLLPYRDFSGYDYRPKSEAAVARLSALQKKVEDAGAVFLYVGVDEQRTALADRYPPYLYSQSDYYETMGSTFRGLCAEQGIHTLFIRDHYDEGTDKLEYYSAVDHHFNLHGAYLTYRTICESLRAELGGFPVLEEAQLGAYQIPGEFYGSYYRRLYDLSPIREQLTVFDQSILPSFRRWDNGVQTDAPVLQLPREGEKIQYSVFMGGDKAETVIQTDRPELPSILIVGDSFTNPIEALCVYGFNEVRSLDFRHYQEMTLTEYLKLHPVDAVVIIRDNLNYVESVANGNLK